MKKLICILCASLLLLLSGCSGDIYSNYREIEQIMVIQTIGFDKPKKGITLSVSTGNSGGGTSSGSDSPQGSAKTARMSVTADTITLAQEKLRDYSASEELFFAHTSYIAIGEKAAKDSIMPYLMYIGRSAVLREDTPIFIIVGDEASSLVLGAGGEDYDATNVLKSLERNIKHRGDCRIFSASDITADLNQRNACLVTAIKCEKAKNVIEDLKDDELTAVPYGYAVICDGKMLGTLGLDCAKGISILQNKLKSCHIELDVGGQTVAVLIESCRCKITPEVKNGKVVSLDIDISIQTALSEAAAPPHFGEISRALNAKARSWVSLAMKTETEYGCDFIGLGKLLETKLPVTCTGQGEHFSDSLASLTYNINVRSEISRSFDLEAAEDSQ